MVELVKPEKPVVADVVCAQCGFFVKSKNSIGQGDCHRYPPQLLPTNKGPASMHTPVKEGDFCGEFKESAGE